MLNLSPGTAIILLIVYVFYVLFQLKTPQGYFSAQARGEVRSGLGIENNKLSAARVLKQQIPGDSTAYTSRIKSFNSANSHVY